MITRVVHGWRPGGLLAYLLGPGRAEEHRHPRVIASWDGRDAAWQPKSTGPGECDLELGPLVRALRAPAVAAGLPERPETGQKRGYVWHCSARVAAGDRVLTDSQWADIARDLVHGAGVAERGDAGGPRWFAIRHADDHIHIAVVLVRQDTARRFSPYRDFPRLRETARAIEERLSLTPTAAADGTAARAPGRGEIEKAARQGRIPARIELRRAAKAAAIVGHDVESFRNALLAAGYLVEIRYAPSGVPLGYKVARRGDCAPFGDPIFYSGSKLAPDLSLPRLLRHWTGSVLHEDSAGAGGAVLGEARRRIDRARRAVVSASDKESRGDVEDIVHAAGEVATAIGAGRWAGRDLSQAAELFDRAARAPRGVQVPPSPHSAGLRRAARSLIRRPWLGAGDDAAGAVALALALAALMQEIAAWQRERGRHHQAAAADAAAACVIDAYPGEWPELSPGSRTEHLPARRTRETPDHSRPPAPQPRIEPSAQGASPETRG